MPQSVLPSSVRSHSQSDTPLSGGGLQRARNSSHVSSEIPTFLSRASTWALHVSLLSPVQEQSRSPSSWQGESEQAAARSASARAARRRIEAGEDRPRRT